MEPDCYKCKWRGTVPGDAHSCCKHPSLKEITDNSDFKLLSILSSVKRIPSIGPVSNSKLNIKGDPYGISQGWFNFPFNFDPRWLENCDGFEIKEEKNGKM